MSSGVVPAVHQSQERRPRLRRTRPLPGRSATVAEAPGDPLPTAGAPVQECCQAPVTPRQPCFERRQASVGQRPRRYCALAWMR